MAGAIRARLVALAKAIGWSLAFVFIGCLPILIASVVIAFWMKRTGNDAIPLDTSDWRLLLGQAVLLLAGFLPATWLIGVKRLGLTAAELRWRPDAEAKGGGWFARGLALGAAAAAATKALGVLTGGAEWVRDSGSFGSYLVRAGLSFLLLAPAAFSEEVIFRGLPLILFSRVLGRGTAIVVLAILFGVIHESNPHSSALGVGNIVLAGVLLGVAFYTPGGIWTAFGTHLGWNAALAALAAPVSGIASDVPWLDYHPGTDLWLTGGAFGPEGGVLATVAITLAVVVAMRWTRQDTP